MAFCEKHPTGLLDCPEDLLSNDLIKEYFDSWAAGRALEFLVQRRGYNEEELKAQHPKYLLPYEESTCADGSISHLVLADNAFPVLDRNPEIKTLLDVGCGTGLSGKPFIERGYIVDGIDISEKMVQRTREKRYRKVFCGNIIEEAPKIQEKYDGIIAVLSLRYFCLDCFFPAINTVLKDKAVICATLDLDNGLDAFLRKLQEIGFTNQNIFADKAYDWSNTEFQNYVLAIRNA